MKLRFRPVLIDAVGHATSVTGPMYQENPEVIDVVHADDTFVVAELSAGLRTRGASGVTEIYFLGMALAGIHTCQATLAQLCGF